MDDITRCSTLPLPFRVQLPTSPSFGPVIVEFSFIIYDHDHDDLTKECELPSMSAVLSFSDFKNAHRHYFLPASVTLHRDFGTLHEFSLRVKRKMIAGKFPLLPEKPNMDDDISRDAFLLKMEDYLNVIYLDYGLLLMNEKNLRALGIPDQMRELIRDSLLINGSQHFYSRSAHTRLSSDILKELPEDPHETRKNVGWLLRVERAKRGDEAPLYDDRTEQFEEYLEIGEDSIPSDWKEKYILLFLPGLTNSGDPTLGCFNQNIRPFLDQGVHAIFLREIEPFSSITNNALTIAQRIREELSHPEHAHKKVIFFGYSKGGVDCAAALSYCELKLLEDDLIAGLIMLQSPIAGSPFAKKLKLPKSVPFVRAMTEFNHVERMNFLSLHPFRLDQMRIPVLCIVAEMTKPRGPLARNIRRLQKDIGINCDGFVVPEDAIVPDSMVVRIQDLDHFSLVSHRLNFLQDPTSRYRPGNLSVAAVRLLLCGIEGTKT